MMRTTVFSLVLAAWMWPATATGVSRAELKVGDQAPPFTLPGSDGRTYRLADFRGKQVVVLAWFAKAFTSG
jgi:peroxiredoxin Q/BCP